MTATNNFIYKYNNIIVTLEEFNRLVLLNKSVVEIDKDSVFSFSTPKIEVKADWMDFIGSNMRRGKTIVYKRPTVDKQIAKAMSEHKKEHEILHKICMEKIENILGGEMSSLENFIQAKAVSFMPNGTYRHKRKEITMNEMLNLKCEYNKEIAEKEIKTEENMYLDEALEDLAKKEKGTFMKPTSTEEQLQTIQQLKENILNDTTLKLSLVEILGITLCDNKEYIYKVLKGKNLAKKDKTKEQKELSIGHKSQDGLTHANYHQTTTDTVQPMGTLTTNDSSYTYIRNSAEKAEKQGIKDSQTTQKAPIFTYCKVNKEAIEQLALRALEGHLGKYKEYDQDWKNFTRVENADEEYANANFRHSLEIGEDLELEHYVASAWNAVARLQIHLTK
jgi:hypothetical protein